MRVTTRMMMGNMAHWLEYQRSNIERLSTMNSSGKAVNKPSDDPVAAGQILNDQTSIATYTQYQSNITTAQTGIEVGLNTLETVYDLMAQAKDVVVDQAAGDLDTREAMVVTIESLYDQVVDLANTRFGGEYLYSGYADDTAPFSNETEVTGGVAEDVVFDLAGAAATVEIQIMDGTGAVVRTLTAAGGTTGTNTVAWDGLDGGGTTLPDGTYTYTVSAEDAAGDPVAATHTYRGNDGDKKTIAGENRTVTQNQNGGEIFSDALLALSRAMAVMETDPYVPSDLEASISEVADAMETIQMEMVALSVANARMDTDLERYTSALQAVRDKLNLEQACDADLAAVSLQTAETNYEVTLETTSLILNMPNLMSTI